MTENIIEFECVPEILVHNSENYKIYGVSVNTDIYKNIKINKYGNATIVGDIHDLGIGINYQVKAIEESNKFGISYKVMNIRRDVPVNSDSTRTFLSEILTPIQVDSILNAYPDIIDRVIKGKTDDIDLQKTPHIKEYIFNVIKRKITENFVFAELVDTFKGLIDFNTLKKLYEKYPSSTQIKKALKTQPYESLCKLSRVGFKRADSILLAYDLESKESLKKGEEIPFIFEFDLKTSKQRGKSALMYLLEENESSGNTRISLSETKNQYDKLVPACKEHFIDIIKTEEDIYLDKNTKCLALKSTYDIERYISDRILEGLKIKNVWEFDCEKYRIFEEISLIDEQTSILYKICNNNVSILNGSAGCVDCDTEYFNGFQWKKISEYNGENVLQYNKDGTANLIKPSLYHKYPEKDFCFINNTSGSINQVLSPEHNIVYLTSRQNINIITLEEMLRRHNESPLGFSGKFITTFKYNGEGIDLSNEEIKLMMAVICDGHFASNTNLCRINLKKQRKKDKLEKILNDLGINYKKTISSTEGYHVYSFISPRREKFFSEYWYKCSKEQLSIITNEVLFWDGAVDKMGRKSFSTSNKLTADFIQFAFSACGYRSTINIRDRRGESKINNSNGKEYIRKSIEYTVIICKNLNSSVSICARAPKEKCIIEKYESIDNYKYCFTVPSGMLVLRRNDKIFITGNCGKSQTTKAVINLLKDNNKSFKLLSPTGRAAKVLQGYTGEQTSTIHRGLGYQGEDNWTYNENKKLDYDIIIVDEVSMVDIFLMEKLLKAIDFSKTKLLLVGDGFQIPSVGAGNVLFDLSNSEIIPITTLTKVFRFGEGGKMTVATMTRLGDKFIKDEQSELTTFGDDKDYVYMPLRQTEMLKNVKALYSKLLTKGKKPEDILILSSYNKGEYGSIAINNEVQKIANPNYFTSKSIKHGETVYYEDDLVIQLVNNYKAKPYIENDTLNDFDTIQIDEEFIDEDEEIFIPNGEIGKIVKIKGNYMVIKFDNELIKYTIGELNQIKLAYCITLHKSQGGSVNTVILLTPKSHTYMLNANLLYVGQTRATDKVYHFGEPKTVNLAIKKKANFDRKTFLRDMMVKV